MLYDVPVTLYTRSAANVGIIGLESTDPNTLRFTVEANSDEEAYRILCESVALATNGDPRPLAGKSYVRGCRPALRAPRSLP